MTTNLSVTDQWNATPTGPVVGEPHGPANYCTDLGQLTEREQFLYNRLIKPVLGTPKTFLAAAVNTGTERITITGHGQVDNTLVRYANIGGTALSVDFGSGAAVLPTDEGGLSLYAFYLRVVDANTVYLSLTSGGSAVNITDAGSGTHYLWILPAQPLKALVHPSFTDLGGNTIPAGSLYATIAGYLMSRLGGTFTGPVVCSDTLTTNSTTTHTAKVVQSGNNAYPVQRDGDLNNAATQTFTPGQKDFWQVPDVGQDSTYTMSDPPEAGLVFDAARLLGTNAFKAEFVRADASLVARFPASSKAQARFRSFDAGDGLGVAWHCTLPGANVTVYS